MGPSVSFPLPLTIAQKLPARNSWALITKKFTDTVTDFYNFELIREVLANTTVSKEAQGWAGSFQL